MALLRRRQGQWRFHLWQETGEIIGGANPAEPPIMIVGGAGRGAPQVVVTEGTGRGRTRVALAVAAVFTIAMVGVGVARLGQTPILWRRE